MEVVKPALGSFLYSLIPWVILLAAVSLLYSPVVTGLLVDWGSNDNYSHGYFIPLVSCYMLYTIRASLADTPLKPTGWGLVILIAGLAQLYIAQVGSELFLQRTSIIPILIGIVLFLLGAGVARKTLLPICYLIFMVPLPAIIWNKIAFPMQLFSSAVTERVVQMLGIPIFREGNILYLAQTTLEVIDACSGLRSLVTMFALSAALGWFMSYSYWKKWLLFFSAVPVAVFTNIARLTGTAVLAAFYGEKVAQGFLHEFSGFLTFLFGLFLLVLTNIVLQFKR